MEHEFRIREELFLGRAEASERWGPLSGEAGRAVHPGDGEELDGGAEAAGEGVRTAAQSAGGLRSLADERGSAGAAGRPVYGSGAVRATGWEPERELCFQRGALDGEGTDFDQQTGGFREAFYGGSDPGDGWEDQRAGEGLAALSAHAGRGDGGVHGLGDSLTSLGRAVEGAVDPAPVQDATTMPGHTDHKRLRQEQEKKIALGYKEDDHEEQQQTGPAMNTPW
jgi:hypothetical protein